MSLSLKGLSAEEDVDDLDIAAGTSHVEAEEEKKKMMDTVVAELKQHGDIDE